MLTRAVHLPDLFDEARDSSCGPGRTASVGNAIGVSDNLVTHFIDGVHPGKSGGAKAYEAPERVHTMKLARADAAC